MFAMVRRDDLIHHVAQPLEGFASDRIEVGLGLLFVLELVVFGNRPGDRQQDSSGRMHLALKHKWFIKVEEDVSLGLVEGKHHFHMQPQQFVTVFSTFGSFRRGSRRGEKEGVAVPAMKPLVLLDIEELVEDALHEPNFVRFTFNGDWFAGGVSIAIPFGNSRVVLDCRI